MKKIYIVLLSLLWIQAGFSQQTQILNPKVERFANGGYFKQCTAFEITRPLGELAAEQEAQRQVDIFDQKQATDKDRRTFTAKGDPNVSTQDEAAQSWPGRKSLPNPTINFTGQNGGGQSSPLDPNGATGLTAYVQCVNVTYRAYNKTTGAPLMGTLNLSSLMPAANCDAVVLYDKYADRWFIGMLSNTSSQIIMAISTTNNPAGTFYKYTFTPDGQSLDYPKWSVWTDAYYLGMNLSTEEVTAFDRTKMLAGNTAAGMVVLPSPPSLPSAGFTCPLPADADGVLPPAGTPNYIFMFEDNNWGAPAVKDQIHILKMTTNWTTPSSSTLVEDVSGGSPLVVSGFNSFWNNYGVEIAQKGNTQGLDAIQGIFMFRAQFRKWTGYNTVVLNNAVNMNTATGQSGIRWYELRQDQTTSKWTVYQQGSYAPDTENRWMGSIAMDGNGSIGMAYAVSGPGEFPSLRYTGRLSTDPLGTLPYTEVVAKAGLGSQSAAAGDRWGDYASTTIDPSDDLTFWHTGMFGGNGGAEETQIFNFQIKTVVGIEENGINEPVFKAFMNSSNNLLVQATNMKSNAGVVVDLFDIDGKQIEGKKITPLSNTVETTFNTVGLAKGTYLVRIGNVDFQKVLKVLIN
jgi:hypothetical protein